MDARLPDSVQAAQQLGFPVKTDMPRLVYELMDLYHQANPRGAFRYLRANAIPLSPLLGGLALVGGIVLVVVGTKKSS